MKNIFKITLSTILILSTMLINGQNQLKADNASSIVNWKGSKPTGDHYGTVKVKSGSFTIENNMIVAGEFEIDMNSIIDLDMPADNEYNAKLVGHLQSDDFFGVKKYPVALFKVTSSEAKGDKVLINGDLTIKEKTHPVSFLATVSLNGNKLMLKSETFKIDRSKWDIKFKSKSFFGDLGDNFIYDDMELSVLVNAG